MKRTDFTEYDDDFADELFPFLKDQILRIVEKSELEKYSNLIEKNYPNKLGRVQFKITQLVLSKSDFIGKTEQDWIDAIEKELIRIGEENNINNIEFVLIGDNEIKNSYQFIYKDFLKFFCCFFSVPQHTYLISKDGDYLLAYTFEDDLYFAIK